MRMTTAAILARTADVGRLTRKVAVAATVAGLIGALGPAVPAQANDGDCGTGDVCLYEHTFFGGGLNDNSGNIRNYESGERFWATSLSINDQVSSARNRGRFCSVNLWEHSWGRGRHIAIAAGNDKANLEWDNFNDMASSHYWC